MQLWLWNVIIAREELLICLFFNISFVQFSYFILLIYRPTNFDEKEDDAVEGNFLQGSR